MNNCLKCGVTACICVAALYGHTQRDCGPRGECGEVAIACDGFTLRGGASTLPAQADEPPAYVVATTETARLSEGARGGAFFDASVGTN